MRGPLRSYQAAEERVRRADFEGAARSLEGPFGGLALEAFLSNTPSHDLMYSSFPAGRRVPDGVSRAWRRAASRRGSAPLWVLVGAAALASRRYRAALEVLDRALAIEDLPAARFLRAAAGLALARRERHNARLKACVEDLDLFLAAFPGDARGLRLRAELRTDRGDPPGARADLERALAVEPENAWAKAELAELLCDERRFAQALAVLDSLRRQGRGQAWYWALRGRAEALAGQPRRGLRSLGRALRLDPDLASAVGWRGEIRRRMGRYQEALKDFNRSIAMDRGFVYAYEWRARLLLMLGRVRQARADADFIVRRDGRHQYGPALRGEALFKLGRYREALRDFELAQPLHPRRTWNPRVGEGERSTGPEREAAFWRDIEEACARSPRDPHLRALATRLRAAVAR